jgi:uncharacterized protein (TIGR03435 family)
MKKCLLVVALLVASFSLALRAQDLAGQWQGTLQVQGRDLRMVFKITTGGGLKAVIYNIDQGGGLGLPANGTVQAGSVKFEIPGINGSFEGRLSDDGSTIEGKFAQGQISAPLVLKKANADTAWALPTPAARPAPMPADFDPGIEVATIKPSRPDQQGQVITVRGRSLVTINQTVRSLMTFAYGIHPNQISGGPDWIGNNRYDITAQPEGTGMPNDRQLRSMLSKLLADRFKLTFHREQKELSVYALTVLPSGPKMTKDETDPNGLPGLFFRALGVMPVRNAKMQDFTGVMQAVVLDRPVVDQTGLEGRYDFTLTWTPDASQFGGRGGQAPPADPATAPPGLFTAIQEQLGLKLEPTKLPVDVLVIDRLEQPSEN